MGSKLEKGESVPEGVRRIVLRHVDDALDSLGNPPSFGTTGDAIGNAWGSVVHARAVLLLLRPALPDKRWKKLDRRFRRVFAPLSGAHEAAAAIDALDLIQGHYLETLRPSPFEEIRAHLVERHTRSLWVAIEHEGALERSVHRAERARAKLASADLAWDEAEPLWLTPIRRSFKRARAAMGNALDSGTPADYRSWRQEATHLRHHLSALAQAWAGRLDRASLLIHELTDLLDEYHHLNGLASWLGEVPAVRSTAARRLECRAARGLIAGRLQEIREDAAAVGQGLFARRPREVAGRLRTLWDAWLVDL